MRTTVKAIVSATILLSFCLTVFSQQVAKTIPNATSPDGIIGFLEFKPKDYGSQKHPLIIFLHGIGERGNGTSQLGIVANNAIPYYCSRGASMSFTVYGQTSSFVVLSPQLSTSYGYWPTFYVNEMIKYAKANLQIDPDRIYITGLSLGGGGVWRSITDVQNGDYTFDAGIAAAAPVCGTQEETDANFCSTIGASHLPVWAFHSMDDATVGVSTTQHAQMLATNCGLSPAAKFTYYQTGGHSGAWINAYDTGHITVPVSGGGSFTANPNLYEWLLSNKRSTGQGTTNTAPVANAGSAQAITLPLSAVTLTGSGTGTNGAAISSYSWTKTSGPSGGTISVPLLNTTLVTGLVQGTYVFTLTVTDNHGLTNSASVTITVNPVVTANQTPISNAGPDVAISLPANSVTLDAGASSDPDGKIVQCYWKKVSGPSAFTIADPLAVNTTFSNLSQGVYIMELQVKDDKGALAYSSKTITVNPAPGAPSGQPGNQPPVSNAGANVVITLPTNSATLDAGASSDPDGKIVQYYWKKVSGPATGAIADPLAVNTTLSSLVQGTYIIELQAKDDKGALAYSYKTVTVNPLSGGTTVNQTPVSIAGANVKLNLPANSTALDGGASYDPDGTIIEYYWKQVSGPSIAGLSNLFGAKINVSNLVQGVYTLLLQVKDNKGAMAYSGLLVTVSSPGARTAAPATTAEEDQAMLKRLVDSATAAIALKDAVLTGKKLTMYPNPVSVSATIELNSENEGDKTIFIYNSNGVLAARYVWKTVKGKNIFSLKNISGLTNGLYVVDVKDSKGKSEGSLKFLKIQ